MEISDIVTDYLGAGAVYAGIIYFFDNPLGYPISYCLGKGLVWPWSMNGGIEDIMGWGVFFVFLVVSMIWNSSSDEAQEEVK